MSTLAELFESDSARSSRPAPAVSSESLAALFPSQPAARPATAQPPADDVRALQAVVGGRGPALPGGGPIAVPKRIRRAGDRRDWLSIIVAVVAVVAMVVTAVVAWVAVSSATPEADALRTLSQTEAVLSNDIQSVGAGIERLSAARDASLAHAAALEPALAGLEDADGVDEKALGTAQQAQADYAAALAAIAVPEPLPAYVRPPVDEESLASIGAAIDGVTARSGEVADAAGVVADLESQLGAVDATFAAAMATFAATFPPQAKTIVDDSPDAEQSFRDAVTDAAEAVSAGALATPESAATLTAYTEAVEELTADQARAEEAIRQEELRQQRLREEQERREASPSPSPSPTTEPEPPADEG